MNYWLPKPPVEGGNKGTATSFQPIGRKIPSSLPSMVKGRETYDGARMEMRQMSEPMFWVESYALGNKTGHQPIIVPI